MKLYANATLRIVEKNSFADENNQTVEFFTNFLKNEDGEVIEVNSKEDYSEHEGKFGVAAIRVRKQDTKGFKLTLAGFVPGEAAPEEEDTVE